jgi:acyl dehydratase
MFRCAIGIVLAVSPAFICIGCGSGDEPAVETGTPAGETGARPAADDFITLYPGVYTGKESALVEKYIADNRALEAGGGVDIHKLVSGALPDGTPGVGPTIEVTETMVRYFNEMRDPDNPLMTDAEYARKAGYQDILAYPAFAAHDDSFMVPYPPEARDTLLVADLIHSNTFYRPVYPGDTLYLVNNSRHFRDLTPEEGAIYRSLSIVNRGSVYNQRGEKVMDMTYSVEENIKIYKEGLAPENPTFADFWEEWDAGGTAPAEAPGGRKVYYYTDEDWETIRDIWSGEERQGAEPLYWEDVSIGDQPGRTLEGPLDSGVSVAVPWGMGLGGNRSLKKEVMDPELFKTLVRHEADGIYRPADLESYIPPVPEEARTGMAFGDMGEVDAMLSAGQEKISYGGAGMMNFARRDLAVRHLNDWIGDQGWIYNLRWGGLFSEDMVATANGRPHPAANPDAEKFLDKVPAGLLETKADPGGGTAFIIVRSYVYDKYVKNGEFYVDLIWWIETFPAGSNWGSGGATVRLPSKSAT